MSAQILITGDYCPISRNRALIENGYSTRLFGGLAKFIREADWSITNLECPVTEKGNPIRKTGPNIKTDIAGLVPLKEVGFQMVTLANNHIMDYGATGLRSTLAACQELGLATVGAGANWTEARKPSFINVGGRSIGVINIAENEFCTTTGKEYGANPLNAIQNHYDITAAKEKAEWVIVIAHGGREHYQLPTPKQRERFRFFIDSGADIVVGHHTHCTSGYEHYKSGHIFYSLGNFLFDYKKKYRKGLWTQGMALLLDIKEEEIGFELIPFHQGRNHDSTITLFSSDEKAAFFEAMESINEAIVNDDIFFEKWESYLKTQKFTYKGMLLLQNKYIRYLIAKGWWPPLFFHSKTHQLLLLNLLKCETHREILTEIIDESIQ